MLIDICLYNIICEWNVGLYSLIIKDILKYNSYLNQREIENINHHTKVLSYIIDNLEDLIEYYKTR